MGIAPTPNPPNFILLGPNDVKMRWALDAFQSFGYQTGIVDSEHAASDRFEAALKEKKPVALHLSPLPPNAATVINHLMSACCHPEGLLLTDHTEACDTFHALKPTVPYHICTPNETKEELRNRIARILGKPIRLLPMTIRLISFGFKYCIPKEANTVFDATLIPNPFYIPELRPFTGLDKEIKNHLFSLPETNEFIGHITHLLAWSIPQSQREGKGTLTIAVGCTGGKHRSVAVVEKIAEFLRALKPQNEEAPYTIEVEHRDIKRDVKQ